MSGHLSPLDHFNDFRVDDSNMVDELGATEQKGTMTRDDESICAEVAGSIDYVRSSEGKKIRAGMATGDRKPHV